MRQKGGHGLEARLGYIVRPPEYPGLLNELALENKKNNKKRMLPRVKVGSHSFRHTPVSWQNSHNAE